MDGNTSEVIIAAILAGGGMVTAIIYGALNTWKKVVTIQAEAQIKSATSAHDEVESLRREVSELRDTATRYDLSFDSALQRIESRVGHLEQRAIDSAVHRVGER